MWCWIYLSQQAAQPHLEWLRFKLCKNKMSGVLLLLHHSVTPYFQLSAELAKALNQPSSTTQLPALLSSPFRCAGSRTTLQFHQQCVTLGAQICLVITPFECLPGLFLSSSLSTRVSWLISKILSNKQCEDLALPCVHRNVHNLSALWRSWEKALTLRWY